MEAKNARHSRAFLSDQRGEAQSWDYPALCILPLEMIKVVA
jgi:hypothetical protein